MKTTLSLRLHQLICLALFIKLSLVLTSCLSADPAPLVLEDLHEEVNQRSSSLSQDLATTTDLGIEYFGLSPEIYDGATPISRLRGAALLYQDDLVTARRSVRTLAAGASGRGALSSLTLGYENTLSSGNNHHELDLMVILEGLFGIGRTHAEDLLAEAELRHAWSLLEENAWRVLWDVSERTRTMAATHDLSRRLHQLLGEVQSDQDYLETLHRQGLLSDVDQIRVRTAVNRLKRRCRDVDYEIQILQVDLAAWVGLSPSDQETRMIDCSDLESEDPLFRFLSSVNTETLFLPLSVRRGLLDYARAEAEVRRSVAESWPALDFGPRVEFGDGSGVFGLIGRLDVPLPEAANARVAVALSDREGARESLLDKMIKAGAALATSRTRKEYHRENRTIQEEIHKDALLVWKGARLRLREDPQALDRWLMAIDSLAEATSGLVHTRLASDNADADYLRQRGIPRPLVSRDGITP